MKFMLCSRLIAVLALSLCCVAAGFAADGKPAGNPFLQTVRVAPNLEPAIPHPEQDAEVRAKLERIKAKTGRAPNILILLVDDMGYGDPGAFGGGAAIGAPTPNIDALASGGLKLTSTYAQPTCTPTRAAINTGRLPTRSGLTRPILTGENPKVNPWADEATAAGLLSEAGYRTGMAGKWHLGEAIGTQPHQVGYDEYFGILSVVSEMSQVIDGHLYPEIVNKAERLAKVKQIASTLVTRGLRGQPTEVVKKMASIDDLSRMDQMFADWSDGFIRRSAKDKKPFYLVHAFSKVHNDNYPAPGYAGKSPAGLPYKDAVVEVDDIVGRLINTLKETGQLENTLVFFTSDNGANEDTWPDTGFQPFRGGKGTTWEGGVRVPGIAYWPGTIKAGRTSDGLFDLTDLFNTSLALGNAHEKIAPTRYIDGVNQTGFLLGDNGESARQAVFMYSENNLMAMRWQEFKIHMRVFNTAETRQNIDASTIAVTGMSPWVFNLYADPKEQRSSGHRYFEWGFPVVLSMMGAHAATFAQFPRKDIGLSVAR